ncbi:hypothetical protein BDBG_04946 [Blastomyces gilchristii SLH14081]|uniref:Uncharacterized protein n=1 Tax=Blastomyces gilchristii (strain SLH14081) TaxID=559298 RepID=A0A179UNA1_BLAGS|nr:uncharacterized protein BDBG_04946 [Blastomyces gilchristii SLH14081]OAT08708.1 hypothetical protein BDBG_04946 [Blastomyces gilchristii SLH14081]
MAGARDEPWDKSFPPGKDSKVHWMDAWNQSVQEWDGGGRAIQEAKQPVSGRRGDEKKRREKEYRSLKGRKEVIMMTTLWRRREERRDDEEEEEEEEEEDKLRETRDGAEQAAASDVTEHKQTRIPYHTIIHDMTRHARREPARMSRPGS